MRHYNELNCQRDGARRMKRRMLRPHAPTYCTSCMYTKLTLISLSNLPSNFIQSFSSSNLLSTRNDLFDQTGLIMQDVRKVGACGRGFTHSNRHEFVCLIQGSQTLPTQTRPQFVFPNGDSFSFLQFVCTSTIWSDKPVYILYLCV